MTVAAVGFINVAGASVLIRSSVLDFCLTIDKPRQFLIRILARVDRQCDSMLQVAATPGGSVTNIGELRFWILFNELPIVFGKLRQCLFVSGTQDQQIRCAINYFLR